MLQVRELSMSFGPESLFSHVSFFLANKQRAALIGPNGCGKTTLLRTIAGECAPTAGAVAWVGRRPRIAYVAQEAADALQAQQSAGQRMRGRLRAAFATGAALLLLDEPTNHLDADALDWLRRAMLGFDGAILFACHDRAFIDAVASQVLHLTRGRLRAHAGGYSAFAASEAHEREAAIRDRQDFEKRRRALAEAARRQHEWAERSHRKAGERNPYGKKRAARLMQRATASAHRLQRLEAQQSPKPWQEPALSFSFLPVRRLPRVIARAQAFTFRYEGADAAALRALSFELGRHERLSLDGPNGSGKSTLLLWLAAVAGETPAPAGSSDGRLSVHPGARVAVFSQEGAVDPDRSPLEQMLACGARDQAVARTLLGHFHLRGESALRPARGLSSGERVRCALAMMLVAGPDILLLDEPTNHLDIEGREALEQALQAYPGATVFASHDRRFRTAVATRALSLTAAAAPWRSGPGRREILQMRLAALCARQNQTHGTETQQVEAEIARLITEIRALDRPRSPDGRPR